MLASGEKSHGEQDIQAQLANRIARFDHLHRFQWPDLNHYGDQTGFFQLSRFRLQKGGMDIHSGRYTCSCSRVLLYDLTEFLVTMAIGIGIGNGPIISLPVCAVNVIFV